MVSFSSTQLFQGIGSFQYIRVLGYLFNLFNIGLMASRYEQVNSVPQAGQMSSHSVTEREGDTSVRHSSGTPIPFLLPTCSVLPWECQNLGEPRSQRTHLARGEEQGSAEQQGELQPASMVPVAGAPYAPGALLYLCLSSPQGTVLHLPFSQEITQATV